MGKTRGIKITDGDKSKPSIRCSKSFRRSGKLKKSISMKRRLQSIGTWLEEPNDASLSYASEGEDEVILKESSAEKYAPKSKSKTAGSVLHGKDVNVSQKNPCEDVNKEKEDPNMESFLADEFDASNNDDVQLVDSYYFELDLEDEEESNEETPSSECANLNGDPYDSEESDISDETIYIPSGPGVNPDEADESSSCMLEDVILQPNMYKFYDAINKRMSLCLLKTQIFLHGHLTVQVLFGRLSMLGYVVDTAEDRTIHASDGYCAIDLTPIPNPMGFNKRAFENILMKCQSHFLDADISEVSELFDPYDSVLVLLRSDNVDGTDTAQQVCKFIPDLFPTTSTINQQGPSAFRTTELLLDVAMIVPDQSTTRQVSVFQHNPVWDSVELKPGSRLVVVGGKGAGKSMLCQYLINRNIKKFGRILLLDLDIGQPLLHLPETLSGSIVDEPILGVGCFSNVTPHKCLLFGSLNVVSSPVVYAQNVSALVEYYASDPELKDVPWIVNTMGYVAGFGEELTAAIVRLVQPTDLIQLTIPRHFKRVENYAHNLTAGLVNAFKFNILQEEVNRQPCPAKYCFHPMAATFEHSNASYLPPKRRTIYILAQLVKILGKAQAFTDVTPHSVSLDEIKLLITRDDYIPTKGMQECILNGTLTYLCEPLENGQYNCHGIGIVRAVDKKNNVHLLHSLPTERLAKVKILALCNTSLPGQVFMHLGPKIEGQIPYLQNIASPVQKS